MLFSVVACLFVFVAFYWYWTSQRHAQFVSDIHKKCVFITGCDSGFGHATARRLDSKGVHVFAGCFTEKGAENLRQRCSSRLKTIIVDVTKPETIKKAHQYVAGNIPDGCEFWGLINNAGVLGTDGPIDYAVQDDYRRLLETNFLGMTEVNINFLPLLKKSRGRIVNMASMTGITSIPTLAPYAASKHAVVAYSNSLRMEQSVWGVHVAIVAPGGFGTQIVEEERYIRAKTNQWERLSPELQEAYGKDMFFKVMEGYVKWKNDAPKDLSPVVNAYEHALLGKHPQAYYYPDTQAKIFYVLSLLPRWLYDKIMIRQFVTSKVYLPKILEETGLRKHR